MLTNEIVQFSERKLIDINNSKWSFNTIVSPANSMLKQYDTVEHVLFYLLRLQKLHFMAALFICIFIQNYKFNIEARTLFKQIRHFLSLPVSDIYYFLYTKPNKNLLSKHCFVTSAISGCKVCSSSCARNLRFKPFFFENVIIKQL